MQKFLIPHKERKVKAFEADGEVSKEFLGKEKNIFFAVFMMVRQRHFKFGIGRLLRQRISF